ncbi:MAG: bifunctional ornithine acetyltransferase/N-acetylglutamate synthase [Candidatus Melainabacteria bacterium RIFCSPLOWO2_12_FULL_35_11]|nr:MAG: bifunctional ornithine acetyltransferase/N-acetylglutamate synthase [Candidatus Melainabacteria bacterium RIFCSPLOWO2_12_FULL_35_11]
MSLDFYFSSATCGFKKSKKPDLAVIYSDIPCTYSGVFTTNQIHAACVDENKRLLKKRKKIRAIIVNSGNANACTGKKGVYAVKKTQEIAANLLRTKPDEVLVASTGVIGVHLDMEKMENGLKKATSGLSVKNLKSAAKAILTTDRFLKIVTKKTKDFSLTGFTKGAGMIHPNMATMLCFLMTDLNTSQKLLQNALKTAINNSFNNISVDGDMSTNDMVILISNRQSKQEIKSQTDPVFTNFQKVLNESCIKLAEEIVIDGEGANKLITVSVLGAKTTNDAKEIARSISSSTLFKCAIFGSDPNWGRAASRIGCTSVKIDPKKIDVFLNSTQVYKKGSPLEFNKAKLKKQIKKSKGVTVTVNLNLGNKSASAFGCDLSFDYVKLNSMYFS